MLALIVNYENKSLNSDGQQFNTNINKANNHLSPQIIHDRKRPRHMALEIQVLALDRHLNVVGSNCKILFYLNKSFFALWLDNEIIQNVCYINIEGPNLLFVQDN